MNLIELQHALRQLRLGGIATVQAEAMAPIDLISCLVADELTAHCGRGPVGGHHAPLRARELLCGAPHKCRAF